MCSSREDFRILSIVCSFGSAHRSPGRKSPDVSYSGDIKIMWSEHFYNPGSWNKFNICRINVDCQFLVKCEDYVSCFIAKIGPLQNMMIRGNVSWLLQDAENKIPWLLKRQLQTIESSSWITLTSGRNVCFTTKSSRFDPRVFSNMYIWHRNRLPLRPAFDYCCFIGDWCLFYLETGTWNY
jgi:hypothetical protein